MAEPFYAEIRMWGCNFAPRDWAFCNGQILEISQYTALFALINTYYGGDGRTSFGLPNLQSRRPAGTGQSSGTDNLRLGQAGGYETLPLLTQQMPSHTHALKGSTTDGTTGVPATNMRLSAVKGVYATEATNPVNMHSDAIGSTGSGIPHENRSPYLVVNFCIALTGVWPSRP